MRRFPVHCPSTQSGPAQLAWEGRSKYAGSAQSSVFPPSQSSEHGPLQNELHILPQPDVHVGEGGPTFQVTMGTVKGKLETSLDHGHGGMVKVLVTGT